MYQAIEDLHRKRHPHAYGSLIRTGTEGSFVKNRPLKIAAFSGDKKWTVKFDRYEDEESKPNGFSPHSLFSLDVMLSNFLGKLRSAFNCLPYLEFLQSKYCNRYCRTAFCIISPTRIYNMHFNTQRQTTPFGFSLLFQSSCQNVRFSGSVTLFICFDSFYLSFLFLLVQ